MGCSCQFDPICYGGACNIWNYLIKCYILNSFFIQKFLDPVNCLFLIKNRFCYQEDTVCKGNAEAPDPAYNINSKMDFCWNIKKEIRHSGISSGTDVVYK